MAPDVTQGDTIVALATPPGPAALAVIRISGPAAFEIVRGMTPGRDVLPPSRVATLCSLHAGQSGELLDQAIVTLFPAPNSYTGESLAELSTHGGWVTPQRVLAACLEGGARMAEPGEFTRRAYLNGRMDLVQAEAVLDLIESRNQALHSVALHQLEAGLSDRLAGLRQKIVRLEALLMHHLDFPEEDEPPVSTERVIEEANTVVAEMDLFIRTAPEGELLREGALTVLAGRPNSGKSSLFNALIGEERAIVTDIPGTTRDALEAVLSIGGFPFRFVDTAGLRDTDGQVEQLGIEVAQRYLKVADLILLCVSVEEGMGEMERAFLREMVGKRVVLIMTKSDLGSPLASGVTPEVQAFMEAEHKVAGRIALSVKEGSGLDDLAELLPDLVYRGLVHGRGEVPVLTRSRQIEGLRRAHAEVAAFVEALGRHTPAEVASTHLRSAETALEELLGVISRDEILEAVFREFCVGK